MRDQFQRVQHGQVLPGLPSDPWNKMLDLTKNRFAGVGPGQRRETGVEFLVTNGTANPLPRFSILQVTGPLYTFSADPDQFFERDTLVGATPAAATPFVVTQEPLSAGEVGWARLLGLTRCKVTINSTGDRYADCTTATDKLSSSPSGPARIIADEDSFAATGDKWAIIDIVGGSGPAAYTRFTLPGALATTDASKASCTVDSYFGGSNPGSTITVYNMPASSNYVFSGATNNKGLAVWDNINARWQIIQMQC